MLNVQEAEKKKIAHKLHEGIAQNLAAIKNNIEVTFTKQSDNHADNDSPLRQAIHILQGTIQEVRALSMDLRPPSLDDFGLIKTINWLCNEYRELYPDLTIKTTFEIDESSLSGSVKTLIYRITQEALENITKIGDADVVELNLTGNTNTISLVMQDNALAYHPKELPPHQNTAATAFDAMKERTVLSGGSFSIDSTQRGTLAMATWEF